MNTVYFWEDINKGLSEVYRVLRKGGIFSNAFYSKAFLQKLKYTQVGFRYFEPQEIVKMVKQIGFTKVTVKKISHDKGFIINCVK